jgi:hypothetical protein
MPKKISAKTKPRFAAKGRRKIVAAKKSETGLRDRVPSRLR